MSKIVFEVCAESMQACVAAEEGGADRIELCSALSEGGLTPSHGLIRAVRAHTSLPIHVMLRPRAGHYVYSDVEFSVMQEDLMHAKSLGASGFVFGILHPDTTVDVSRVREMVALARPLEVTFHRAYDSVADPRRALEDVISTGVDRILTSGGRATVLEGVEALRQLVVMAQGRVQIAVGGGLRVEHAAHIATVTKAEHFHGSVRTQVPGSSVSSGSELLPEELRRPSYKVNPTEVQAMIRALRSSSSNDA